VNGDYTRSNSNRQEFRRAKRRRIEGVVQVIDAMTDAVVGRIGNLSENGLLLLAAAPLADDARYPSPLAPPTRPRRTVPFEAGMHALWQDRQNAAGQSWIGLRMISVSEDQLADLRQWLDAPGARYD